MSDWPIKELQNHLDIPTNQVCNLLIDINSYIWHIITFSNLGLNFMHHNNIYKESNSVADFNDEILRISKTEMQCIFLWPIYTYF